MISFFPALSRFSVWRFEKKRSLRAHSVCQCFDTNFLSSSVLPKCVLEYCPSLTVLILSISLSDFHRFSRFPFALNTLDLLSTVLQDLWHRPNTLADLLRGNQCAALMVSRCANTVGRISLCHQFLDPLRLVGPDRSLLGDISHDLYHLTHLRRGHW